MLSDTPFVSYALLDPRRYESLDRYEPSPEFRAIAARYLNDSWTITPRGFWTTCSPAVSESLQHAWKIHVSSTPWTAGTTLERVIPILAEEQTSFKFCSDTWMLTLSVSKNWSQAQAGKMIAIYPRDLEHFRRLLDRLHQATRDLSGPYILSDRPYKNSKVVFYRYGEHRGIVKPTERGHLRRGYFLEPDSWYADDRVPFFRLPAGIEDPISAQAPPRAPEENGVPLQAGRYLVKRAMKFNAVGGIYAAIDTRSGQEVVIREARRLLGPEKDGRDSFALLEKEARILRHLGPTGLFPQFIDLFQEWEHLFLVQEKLSAESLWGHAINFYFTPGYRPADCCRDLVATIRKLCLGLRTVHRHGVILRDLTRNNVLVTTDAEIRFIDLEFAYELEGHDPPVAGFTAGYASPEQMRNDAPTTADDCYALGALILDIVTFTAAGLPLNRAGILKGLECTLRDLQLPMGLLDLVGGLIALDVHTRWTIPDALAALERIPVPTAMGSMFPDEPCHGAPTRAVRRELEGTVDGVLTFLDESFDLARDDRLWPASPEVFITNPVNLQYGAAGPAFLMLRARGGVPDDIAAWIARQTMTHVCPPGLHSGYAGVALLFLAMRKESLARDVLARATEHELRFSVPGLFYGTAGWGLAHLSFWDVTRDQRFLDRACEAAQHLVATACHAEEGCYWETNGITLLGYGEGQSGVALFLLYLHAVCPDPRVLEAAVRAIEYDLSKRQEAGNKLLWYSRPDATPAFPKSPHMWFGTVGVGTAVLRCFAATKEPRYLEFARWCARSVAHRYTNKIWQNYGLAGFGEYLLDMYQLLGEEHYLNDAFHHAEGLLPYRVVEGSGTAFPGTNMFRICSDFGEGTAGIGLFLHRLLNPGTPRLLMLDHLLTGTTGDTTAPAADGAPGVERLNA